MSAEDDVVGDGRPEASSDQEPRYEPSPGVGKLLGWVLVFVLAAIVVVLGGVYFT